MSFRFLYNVALENYIVQNSSLREIGSGAKVLGKVLVPGYPTEGKILFCLQ